MLILNPLEPWPMGGVLQVAEQLGVKVLTRVLDHGGVFFDDLQPDHRFSEGDHRVYRPGNWVQRGRDFVEAIRPFAKEHGLSPLQYAANWNLSHPAVECVIPTFIQEAGEGSRSIESKIEEAASIPLVSLSSE